MSHHESAARGPDARMVDRMLFFSDAVFAIVLTLLAIDLRPIEGHDVPQASVSEILSPIANHLAVFLISFILVGQWWLIHMRATRQLREFDWPTAVCNMFFLLGITLMPFAATILNSNYSGASTAALYWGELFLTAISMTVLFLVMTRDHGRLIGGIDTRERLWRTSRSVIPAVAFLVGFILASSNHPFLAGMCWMLIFPLQFIAALVYRFTEKKGAAKSTDVPSSANANAP